MDYNTYDEITVMLYGEKVGTLFDDGDMISFFYSPKFRAKHIEISPIKLNTTKIKARYVNDEYPEIYKQLPGIIKDSLPDSNGELVMNKYFTAKGLDPSRVSILHRLAFIGNRAMGALEYLPKEHDKSVSKKTVNASQLYLNNKKLHSSTENITLDEIMAYLIDSASPVGGAKQKILICFQFLIPAKIQKQLLLKLEGRL